MVRPPWKRSPDKARPPELLAYVQRALEAAGLCAWRWDALTDKTIWSEACAGLFGLPPGATLGLEAFLSAVHPDDRDRVEEARRRALAAGADFAIEYRVIWHDGTEHWIAANGRAERDASGNPLLLEGFAQDITERKRAEAALRASEERFRALAEGAPIGIFMTRATGESIYGNPAWMAISGLSYEEGMDYGWIRVVHPEDRERVQQTLPAMLARGEKCEMDYRLVTPAGDLRWVHGLAMPQFSETGTIVGWVGTVEDVTERKRAEEAVRASEQRFRTLAEAAPIGIFLTQATGECIYTNPTWTAISGLSYEASIQYGWMRAIHPEDRERVMRDWPTTAALGEKSEMDYRVITTAGDVRWLHALAMPQFSDTGALLAYIGSVEDITERKRAEEERQRLEAQLRQGQKMEALGTLAGGIAHDFNNILAAIAGNAQAALVDLPSASPLRTSICEIERAAARAASLVRRILAFSRQEDAQRRPLALGPVVEEALQLLRATLPAMIEIRAELAAEIPDVLADSTQIHQIIMNLGANSAHAIGDRPGVLEVRLAAVVLKSELAQALELRAGRHVRLSVSDDGSGMDHAMLQRIFDPFFTTKPPGQGTGLGLSVVHGIMRSHSGAVGVESTPGKGTTFHLYFPCLAEASAAAASLAGRTTVHGHGEHVLFVDDEEALVSLAERLLKRLGYRVTGYVDVSKALEAFRARPQEFDVVVTDLAMPGMSGRDFAQELLRIRPDLSIVLMSGYLRPEDVVAAKKLGIREIISKPNSLAELTSIFDQLFRSHLKD